MNFRDVSLFLCMCTLFPIILIGLSIRYYFDNNDYTPMFISIGVVLLIFYIANKLYNNSKRSKDDNGGIRIRQ